jgi:condensation enzyme
MATMSVLDTTPRTAPLTTSQQFLAMFDKGPDHGPFGPRHIMSYGARITGPVDSAALRDALHDVVVRHEALRTTIVRDVEPPYQQVLPPAAPQLAEYPLSPDEGSRDTAAHEFFNRMETGPCPYDEQPLLRAALGRFDDEDSVLVLNAHHMVTDGWSLPIIMRDLTQFYAARRGFGEAKLPEMAQYREFAEWQKDELDGPALTKARAYWREQLAGAALVPLPTDRPRTDAIGVYAVHRFLIDRELTSATWLLAKQLRCSPFMVLFAAYTLMMHKVTGVTDLTLPTMTSGRNDPRFTETVGPIFNFMPLRTDLSECRTFRDLLVRTRTTCLEMYSNEIPFSEAVGQAPHIVAAFEDLDKAMQAFQCFQFPAGADSTTVGDIRITEMRRRVLSAEHTSDIPDGAVWALDILPEGEIACGIKYNTNEFDEATVLGTAAEYRDILRAMVADVDAPLAG